MGTARIPFMKSLLAPLFAALLLPFFLGGCEKAAPPAPDKTVYFQAIEENVHAMEKKDLEAVMATIHPKAPSYASTREIVADMFKTLDLKCTLSDLQVVTATPEEARVSFTQKTEKAGGTGDFQNNILKGVHILRPDNGKWKIVNTIPVSVTGLDGRPLNAPLTPAGEAAPAPPEASVPPTAEPAPAPGSAPAAPAPEAPAALAPPAEKPAQ